MWNLSTIKSSLELLIKSNYFLAVSVLAVGLESYNHHTTDCQGTMVDYDIDELTAVTGHGDLVFQVN